MRSWRKLLNYKSTEKCWKQIQNLEETENLEDTGDFGNVETDCTDEFVFLELLRRIPECSEVLEKDVQE